MNFRDCMACIPDGFKAMVPAIWSLLLPDIEGHDRCCAGASVFVSAIVKSSAGGLMNFPSCNYLCDRRLSHLRQVLHGEPLILTPIVVNVFSEQIMNDDHLYFCMYGRCCMWSHCSPIFRATKIMASAGAQCEHVNHVSTASYAIPMVAAAVSSWLILSQDCAGQHGSHFRQESILMAITLVIIRLKFDDLKM